MHHPAFPHNRLRAGRFRPAFILVSISLATLLAACCTPPILGGSLELGQADNGRQIEVASGTAVTVTLAGNPTTGYAWQVLPASSIANLAADPANPDYRPAPAPDGQVGGGGSFIFRFTAGQPGQAELRLGYRRGWEDLPPLETWTVRLRVK